MGRVSRSTCTLYLKLCTKCEFLQFWNHTLLINVRWLRFILMTRWALDWEASSNQVKCEFASQNYQVISVKKLHIAHGFQWLLLICYNGCNLKNNSLRNAWWTGLDTPSGLDSYIGVDYKTCWGKFHILLQLL